MSQFAPANLSNASHHFILQGYKIEYIDILIMAICMELKVNVISLLSHHSQTYSLPKDMH